MKTNDIAQPLDSANTKLDELIAETNEKLMALEAEAKEQRELLAKLGIIQLYTNSATDQLNVAAESLND
jgi:hypothetical protein